MPNISLPHATTGLRDGFDPQSGAVVLANDQAITAVVNGNLDDDNISASAAIKGTKLSATAGERVPTNRIEDDAVTADKLSDSTTVDGDRAVTTDHIRDGAITTAKILAAAVLWAKIKTLQTSVVFTGASPTIPVGQIFWYDLSSAAPATGVAVTNVISGYDAYVPISVTLRKSAGGAPTSGAWKTTPESKVSCLLFVDPASNKVYLGMRNNDDTTATAPLAGYTVVIESISIA